MQRCVEKVCFAMRDSLFFAVWYIMLGKILLLLTLTPKLVYKGMHTMVRILKEPSFSMEGCDFTFQSLLSYLHGKCAHPE